MLACGSGERHCKALPGGMLRPIHQRQTIRRSPVRCSTRRLTSLLLHRSVFTWRLAAMVAAVMIVLVVMVAALLQVGRLAHRRQG